MKTPVARGLYEPGEVVKYGSKYMVLDVDPFAVMP